MAELVHRLKLFVYRLERRRPDYLLLRGAGPESFWVPVQGPIGFGENIDSAIRRELAEDLGLSRASDLVDLELPARWQLGDEEVIEWCFALRTPLEDSDPRLGPRWSAYRWSGFPEAYPSLELEGDRAAILRLHHILHAA
jgi:ADP-ribose pyrophosphatase YjhB (NUDIX family)